MSEHLPTFHLNNLAISKRPRPTMILCFPTTGDSSDNKPLTIRTESTVVPPQQSTWGKHHHKAILAAYLNNLAILKRPRPAMILGFPTTGYSSGNKPQPTDHEN
ncbi:hypothetical protein AVEN_244698-1 [Araneus ventricosus]|uniref:Uncharacterized protein n=1 Tax=Araneus ventricosus TaxID=182803 RepID=A0A4Y2U2Z0_ARAVE|nr:hypothetical protein AVEN_244698-1 [Araneus ventricosus]